MPNLEWDAVHELVTPEGNLYFNQPNIYNGRTYLTQPDAYKIVPAMRVTQDNLSQTDGSYLHPRWKSGLVATVKVDLVVCPSLELPDYKPACGADLVAMYDDLAAALNSIRQQDAGAVQRLIWTPTGAPSLRMIDDIQTLSWLDPTFTPPGAQLSFAVESPYPYAIDLTQIDTTIDTTTDTITNTGTAQFMPVCKVHAGGSPVSGFTLTNNSALDEFGNALTFVYDASRLDAVAIPAGHYAEIDFFRGTIFLDGSGADLIAGVDPTVSDFWPLVVGANSITTDCDAEFLWNPAWA